MPLNEEDGLGWRCFKCSRDLGAPRRERVVEARRQAGLSPVPHRREELNRALRKRLAR